MNNYPNNGGWTNPNQPGWQSGLPGNEYNSNMMRDTMEGYAEAYDSAGRAITSSTFAILMRKVYVWMALALAVTGLTAYAVGTNDSLFKSIFQNQTIFWILIIAEFGLVIAISAAINKISFATASILFILYSIVNGLTLSVIFLVYSIGSIATTFFITAGAFAGLAAVGYFIKKDLSGIGKFLIFALIGIIIATIVNMFVTSSYLDFIISIVGVLVFAGLTAYDSQKIKNMLIATGDEVNDTTQKIALLGSLSLYLDFINLFLYLLRFLGKMRE